jgi:hypothetical protein
MEAWNDETVPPFPQTLETAKQRRFPHYAPRYDDRSILTFLMGASPCHFY